MMMLCAWCGTLYDKRSFIVGLFFDKARPLNDDDDDDDDDAVHGAEHCMINDHS